MFFKPRLAGAAMVAIFIVVALVSTSQAVAVDGTIARYTSLEKIDKTFTMAPETTPPPLVHELLRRASASEMEVLLAPDNTCGYIDQQASSAYRCVNSQAICAIVPSFGVVACLSSTTDYFVTTCADSQAVASTLCDINCQSQTRILKCTSSTAPYCGTVKFGDGIDDYFCDTVSSSVPYQAYTTYSEQIGRVFFTTTLTFTGTNTESEIGLISTAISPVSSPVKSTASTPDATSIVRPESAHDSSTPIGAIVGGVIGGVALLVLIAFGVWFIIRRKRRGSPRGPQPTMQSSYASYPQNQPQPFVDPQHARDSSFHPHQPQLSNFSDPAKSPSTAIETVSAQPGSPPPPSFTSVPPSFNDINMQSAQPASPTSTVFAYSQPPGAQQVANLNVPPTVYEAGGDMVGAYGQKSNHKGQIHEVE